ncbi:hypothetical protein Tco_0005483 [Tanacetum coccineum]
MSGSQDEIPPPPPPPPSSSQTPTQQTPHTTIQSGRILCINSEGPSHKGYDRFQSLLSQLEIHGAGVSTEDANQKFLRSLPSAWSQVSLIMRTKPGVDSLSFDDLYNNLRVFESDVKGSTASSSSPQNVAFVSENTSSTNEVSTAYSVSNPSGQNSQYEQTSSYLLLANQSSFPQLDHEDLEQIDEYDLEEIGLKWQVAMISMRIIIFYKKTGKRLQFDAKEPVGFDKTKLEMRQICPKQGILQECRTREIKKIGDGSWNLNQDGSRTRKKEDSKALVTIDGEGVISTRCKDALDYVLDSTVKELCHQCFGELYVIFCNIKGGVSSMSDSKDSTVTYTEISSSYEDLSDVGSPGSPKTYFSGSTISKLQEEDHLAPADPAAVAYSADQDPYLAYRVTARMSIRPQAPAPFLSEEVAERLGRSRIPTLVLDTRSGRVRQLVLAKLRQVRPATARQPLWIADMLGCLSRNARRREELGYGITGGGVGTDTWDDLFKYSHLDDDDRTELYLRARSTCCTGIGHSIYHCLLMEERPEYPRPAWAKSMDACDQVQLVEALKIVKSLKTQMIELQKQQGPAKDPQARAYQRRPVQFLYWVMIVATVQSLKYI